MGREERALTRNVRAHTYALTTGYLLAAVLVRSSSPVAADSSVFNPPQGKINVLEWIV